MARPGRLLELVTLLGGRRPLTVQEVASRLDVSVRTAYRDLAEVQSSQIPLEATEGGYKLLESASLRPLNLTAEERAVLLLALANPSLRRITRLRRRLESLESKLAAASGAPFERVAAAELASLNRSGPAAEAALEVFERAITEHRVCEGVYDSLSSGLRGRRRLEPLRVFERGGAWYLAARADGREGIRIFRLDRFDDSRMLESAFVPPADFDLVSFLADTWEVFKGTDEIAAHLRFDASLRPLIERAQHHLGERVELRPDGALDYHVSVSHPDEIARWVVTFGGLATVESPDSLRARVREIAEGAAAASRARRLSPTPMRADRLPAEGRGHRKRG